MTSVLPEATPLGGLACQLDSFKKSFESVVLSCNEVQEEKSKYFELELADTSEYGAYSFFSLITFS
jgi:hypothetical protein